MNPTTYKTEALALLHDIPLALAALLLAGCASAPTADDCAVARMDAAAAEACLAEPTCAAKWDSPTFRMMLDANRETVARCGGAK